MALPLTAQADDPALTPAKLFKPKSESDLSAPRDFQGIPGLAATPSGRLWALWYGGGHDEGPLNYVMLAHSDDRGETWSDIELVIDHENPHVRTFDPVIWTAPDGALWVFYAQAYGWWDGRGGVWAISCSNPDSEMPTWSEPRYLIDGIMMNKPTVLNDGRWLLPVAMWSHAPKDKEGAPERHVPDKYNHWDPSKAGTLVVESSDNGKSFQQIAQIPTQDVRYDEHMIVERNDGSLWLLIRGLKGILETTSTDGGKTWTTPELAGIPHIRSRFYIRRLDSGELLLVRHQTPDETGLSQKEIKDRVARKRPSADRSHLTAYLSYDDGKTWEGGLLLDDRTQISYPDGDQLDDGMVVIAYDHRRKDEREIYCISFTEEDIKAGKFVHRGTGSPHLVNRAPATE